MKMLRSAKTPLEYKCGGDKLPAQGWTRTLRPAQWLNSSRRPRRFNGEFYAVSNALPARMPNSSSHHKRSSAPVAPSMSSMRPRASAGIAQKSARIAASTALMLASMSSQIYRFSSKLNDCGDPRHTSARKYVSSCSCANSCHRSFVIMMCNPFRLATSCPDP